MRRARTGGLAPALCLVLALPAGSADAPRAPGSVFRDCDDCPEMVVVPAGSFVMGTPSVRAGTGVAAAESDAIVVKVTRAFAIGRHEVTRRQYARFVADSAYEPDPGCRVWDPALERFNEDPRRTWQNPATPAEPQDDHPVTCVSFADARAYAQWLSRRTGARYRLPSEAEWEYAARAGGGMLRPWGDAADDGCDHANTYDDLADSIYKLGWPSARCRDGHADLAPVGRFAPNAFGLYDVIGNAGEWVEDCTTGSYVGRPRDTRPWEWLGGCEERIQRGGSWLAPPDQARSAARASAPAVAHAGDVGFRMARELATREPGER